VKVILDPKAGICGGVRRAIELAEQELGSNEGNPDIYVLGDIIHNEREVERLEAAGLKTIYVEDLGHLGDKPLKHHAANATVLIRAHGEPPETFTKLAAAGVEVVDGTCPVVTRSQKLAEEYRE